MSSLVAWGCSTGLLLAGLPEPPYACGSISLEQKILPMNQEILDFVSDYPEEGRAGQPMLTLSYAQSLDGSISLARGRPTFISGPQSLQLTHQLRAAHAAILVGIGTLISDDPQLSVREVAGPDPQPLILDSRLRFPLQAKLLKQNRAPWIFCLERHDKGKRKQLEELGARVFPLAADSSGRIELAAFMKSVTKLGLATIMLEGGASLIASFLSAGWLNKVVITIAPSYIGGLKVVENPLLANGDQKFPRIQSPKSKFLGDDLIIWGAMQSQ